MVGNDAGIEVEIRDLAGDGRPVRLGVTESLEFVDTPGTPRIWSGTGRAATG